MQISEKVILIPVGIHEIDRLIFRLNGPDCDEAHVCYEDILERYCVYPDPKLANKMKELIKTRFEIGFNDF